MTSPPDSAKNIGGRIDAFFATQGSENPEAVRLFVGHLFESYVQAEHSANKAIVGFVTGTAVIGALGAGLINEASILSFKLSNIRLLLVLGPPILAFLSYSLACSAFASINLGHAVGRVYKHVLPKAWDHDLETLLGPPTIMRVERMAKRNEPWVISKARTLFLLVLLAVATLGTGASIAYASYLLVVAAVVPTYASTLSIVMAAIVWFRGMMQWYYLAYF
jgi:hypothetical protein